jgi:glycosyltransferase involved in cell wall biosynthesis
MIDALIISINEPQLDRCIKAVKGQTIPYGKVIHVNGIVPESDAVNHALELVESEWVMKVDGDIILYPNAHKIVMNYMDGNSNVCGYYFGLRDTFLDCDIGFCGVLKTKPYKSVKRKDKMNGDLNVVIELRKQGWLVRKLLKEGIIVGTHFDNPDEFQVFGRFYRSGKRANDNTFEINQLNGLLKKTGDPLYQLALDAIQYAKEMDRYYIGSRNVDFDKRLYEEFKNNGVNRHSNS